MGADSMFEILLNSLGNTAVYVVRKDDYRILYFMILSEKWYPAFEKEFCRELWTGYNELVSSAHWSKKTYSEVGFEETFGADSNAHSIWK